MAVLVVAAAVVVMAPGRFDLVDNVHNRRHPHCSRRCYSVQAAQTMSSAIAEMGNMSYYLR